MADKTTPNNEINDHAKGEYADSSSGEEEECTTDHHSGDMNPPDNKLSARTVSLTGACVSHQPKSNVQAHSEAVERGDQNKPVKVPPHRAPKVPPGATVEDPNHSRPVDFTSVDDAAELDDTESSSEVEEGDTCDQSDDENT